MRSLVVVATLVLFVTTARAQSAKGAYAGWSCVGWFPQDRLAKNFEHADNGAQFALVAGVRWKYVAIEAWTSPAMQSGIAVRGLDAKLLLPLGRYMSTYARLRLGHMTVDLDPNETTDHPLSGYGGGEAIGIQANFPGRLFGLIIPAWFWAPFGPMGTGGFFVEFGHERYDLGLGDGRAKPEGFLHYAYGVTWGTAF